MASGVFVCFTPFFGLHFVLASAIAWSIRGNILAALLATFVGNPLTFPFIWVSTYQTGNLILGGDGRFDPRQLKEGFATLWPLIKPMTIGAMPIA